MENVPGTLLGVFPRWWLFPETVWGSAQLSWPWSDRLLTLKGPLQPSGLCLSLKHLLLFWGGCILPNDGFLSMRHLSSSGHALQRDTPCHCSPDSQLHPRPSAHSVRNAFETLYIENFRKYDVQYMTGGRSRLFSLWWLLCFILFYIQSNLQKIQRLNGLMVKQET